MTCPFPSQQSSGTTEQIEDTHVAGSGLYEEVPQPPEHLFGLLGNLPDIDPSFAIKDIWKLQQLYGPILKMNIRGDRFFVGSQALAHDLCKSPVFHKNPNPVLIEVRALTGDGLFTAYDTEGNWWKAHRLLVPAFGPLGVRAMFDNMLDISSQMVLKWDRLGPEHEIDCSDDFTRLAFDTIGLCAFSYRFNDFYGDHVHPFAQQMADVLLESGRRANRPLVTRPLHYQAERQREENVRLMHKLCDDIVADRKKNPQPDNHDLLHTMLHGVDRDTGESLSDENIRFQMVTLLVAGHETTSGTLSFTYLNLLKYPEKFLKAQKQVDEVVGDAPLTLEHLSKLDYLDACVKETLRLTSPITGFTLAAREDTALLGKYFVAKGQEVTVNLRSVHRDPAIWGEDVEVFRPERFLNGGFQALPPHSWMPFGQGMRSCIGKGFAEQEMVMNIALVLQRFQLELADRSYELQLKSTLTVKPMNFRMKARRRPGKAANVGISGVNGPQSHDQHKATPGTQPVSDKGKPISIFYGGNTGTCESLAQAFQSSAAGRGFQASINSMDAATENLPTDRPVIIITSSYEGHPPDNAKKFVKWLEELESQPLQNVRYGVYGVGNPDWASTFQRIPKLVDECLERAGGSRIVNTGFSNVKADLIGPWEDWSENICNTLAESLGVDAPSDRDGSNINVSIQISKLDQTLGGKQMNVGTVIANYELAGIEVGPAKRHIDVRLPEGLSYQSGDYLVVQPHNPSDSIHRVLSFFQLSAHSIMTVSGSKKKFLPSEPTPVGEFLSSAVELSSPVTKRQIETLMALAESEQRDGLNQLHQQYETVLKKRYSLIDVLEEQPVKLSFDKFIDMLPALAPRQYSISSSPMRDPEIASLTFDVHESLAFSGHGIFLGVTSSYLARRRIGDRIACFVRSTNVGFRLPSPQTPIIMICAGTGIAPMRAFLQERAAIADAGVHKLAPALLYFGCRDTDKDYIYKGELQGWEQKGVVRVQTAFSKTDHQYVQDVIWEDRDHCVELFRNQGKIFLCGSAARLGKSATEVLKRIRMEQSGHNEQQALEWLESVKSDRYISDVY